jgi:predicted DNA-binding transcriptional regulator AlpA
MEKPYLGVDELSHLMGMSQQGVLNAIHRDSFPIPTYKLGKLRVADKRVVEAFFQTQRDIGLEKISTK